MSKPINLYIAPNILPEELGFSLVYSTPQILFSDIHKNRTHKPTGLSYTSCPAVRSNFKKMLSFSNSLDCEYKYDFSLDNKVLENVTKSFINIHEIRDSGFANLPTIWFAHGYFLFADEPLEVQFTPPYFHKPEYMNYGTVIPGSFDVGQWYRPYNFEIQLWEEKGNIKLKDGEPLFYAHLMTDRKVNVHRFVHTAELEKFSRACINSTDIFGLGQTLLSRYKKFKAAGLRENILTEIKKNVVEENFLTL